MTTTTNAPDALLAIRNGSPTARWNFPNAVGSAASTPAGTGTAATVTYSFLTAPPAYLSSYPSADAAQIAASFSAFNEATLGMQTAARNAMAAISSVANISFSQVGGVGKLTFACCAQGTSSLGYAYYPQFGYSVNVSTGQIASVSEDPVAGDIWISDTNNANAWSAADFRAGGTGLLTLIHEIGHAIGLKHSFEGNYTLSATLENRGFSVMSYTARPNSIVIDALGGGSFSYHNVEASTPMLGDIRALQALYGANTSARTGGDVYSWTPGTAFCQTIWDAGGTDLIDCSNQTLSCIVNLQAGAYSSIGWCQTDVERATYQAGGVTVAWVASAFGNTVANNLYDGSNNLAIADNVVIENAYGGSGNDQLTGNATGNLLRGNAGADVLTGNAGSDIFSIAAATDSTAAAMDRITDFQSGDLLRFDGMQGISVRVGNFAWAGSVTATVAAIRADAALNNVIVGFSDGSNLYLTVKGAGTGVNFDAAVVRIDGRTMAITPAELGRSSTAVSGLSPTEIAALAPADMQWLSTSQILGLTTEQAAALNALQIAALSTTQLKAMESSDLAALQPGAVAGLSSSQLACLSPTQFASLNSAQVGAFTSTQLATLAPTRIAALESSEIAALSPSAVGALTAAQVRALSTEDVAALSSQQLPALSGTALASLSSLHIRALQPEALGALAATQFASLSTAQIRALTAAQTGALSLTELAAMTSLQARALTTTALGAMSSDQLAALPATVFASLSALQIAPLSNDIAALGVAGFAALSSAQMRGLSTTAIAALTPAQLAACDPQELSVLGSGQVRAISSEAMAALSSTQIAAFKALQVAQFSAAQVGALGVDDMVALGSSQIRALTTTAVAALAISQLQAIDASDVAQLTSAQVAALNTQQIAALTTTQFAALTTAHLRALGADDIAGLTAAQISAISPTEIKSLTTTQIGALGAAGVGALDGSQVAALAPTQLKVLDAAEIAAIASAAIAQLGTSQVSGLTPTAMAALTVDQLHALTTGVVRALSPTQLATLSPQQITELVPTQIAAIESRDLAALSPAAIAALGSDGAAALNTSQIHALTVTQIPAMTTDQIVAIGSAGIAVLSSSQLAALTQAQADALTAAQLAQFARGRMTPLALDLAGDGLQTLGLGAGVHFDLAASGVASAVGWIAPGDGLLVRDMNGDGVINDGRELFGAATRLAQGGTAADGFAALGALDRNGDGRIDRQDAQFGELQLWVDANSDGISQAGELHALAEFGIVSLQLDAQRSLRVENGNWIGLESAYTTAAGETRQLADVWLALEAGKAAVAVEAAPVPLQHVPDMQQDLHALTRPWLIGVDEASARCLPVLDS